MLTRVRCARDAGGALVDGFAAIRRELAVPDSFDPAVLSEANAVAKRSFAEFTDCTSIPLVTVDPEGSKDLDQALFIERSGSGFRLYYAIADVASFVDPASPLDQAAYERVVTYYSPDSRAPMLPPVLCEGAVSLLPDQERPAVLWTVELDSTGEGLSVDARRVRVRSRSQLSFAQAQQMADAGDELMGLLKTLGELRLARERDRGGVSLTLPEQEVTKVDGGYALAFRESLPVETWNAQMSLLVGSGAAELMLYGEVGILRTMPPAAPGEIARLQRVARALGIAWPTNAEYEDVIRSIDPNVPRNAAFLTAATSLFRGAGYVAFNGGVPEQAMHAAVGGEYAHVTAPMRRLVDRYASEVCLSLCADSPVPSWVTSALSHIPELMNGADQKAHALEHACIDLVESFVLQPMVGQTFDATVVDVHHDGSLTIQLADPAVRARCQAGAGLNLGASAQVKLIEADPSKRLVLFAPA